MKKVALFFIFISFIGVLNAQTNLPTNEELVEYLRKTEYPYPKSQYYKSFLHEFDSYITARELELDQSTSFKLLCDIFIKYPSVEELKPIIIDKIHFKLYRDDFTYWSIKCKLDNKEHSFLITGAGRIIHRDDDCKSCTKIKTKKDQFGKQITEYIAYLKKTYGNLDKAINELGIGSCR